MNGKLTIGSGEEWGRVRLEREAEARSSQASKLWYKGFILNYMYIRKPFKDFKQARQ